MLTDLSSYHRPLNWIRVSCTLKLETRQPTTIIGVVRKSSRLQVIDPPLLSPLQIQVFAALLLYKRWLRYILLLLVFLKALTWLLITHRL